MPDSATDRLSPPKPTYDCHGRLEPNPSPNPIWYDYLDTLEMMEYAMNLHNLKLVFNCAWLWGFRIDHSDTYSESREWFINPISPVQRLASAGLKAFCIRLEEPWRERHRGRITGLEFALEHLVMSAKHDRSQDRYSNAALRMGGFG
jgi:hypothetical protein